MPLSSRLELPYLEPAQAQKHVTHNEALRKLDMLVQLSVQGFNENTPPALPVTGQVFALGAAPTGDWAGQADMLALREDTGWIFAAPQPGWSATLAGSAEQRIWDGAAWRIVAGQSQNLEGLGVNTSSDATNRLAVSAPATLLTHEGADHRLILNKAGVGNTASVLFQSDWSGHAEMGLAGSTGFSIKVSPDGDNWTEALSLSADGATVTGSVIQANPTDSTAGKVMTTGSFGLGGLGLSGHLSDYNAANGVSQFLADAVTGAPSNKPINGRAHAGMHIAANSTRWLQILGEVAGGSDLARLYWRRNYNGTISPWQQIFSQGNILGGVSVSGSLPTGAVIERNSNANGSYMRLADGTQICWRNVVVAVNNTDTQSFQSPGVFAGSTVTAFLSPVLDTAAGDSFAAGARIRLQGGTTFEIRNRAATGQTGTCAFNVCAIGRWF